MGPLLIAAERSWDDVAALRIFGGVVGVLVLLAAIRTLFGCR